jgi:hypothetical protein
VRRQQDPRKVKSKKDLHFKDAILNRLASRANVAQFISFGPGADLPQRFSHVRGFARNHRFPDAAAAITALLQQSPDDSVNVRSYQPDQPKGGAFLYGLKDVGRVVREVRRLASEGAYTIVNETVDVMDGGVSGVAVGTILEFAPQDTPRCVEKPGTCHLPRDLGLCVLEQVYGFRPALDYPPEMRVEFSLHPLRRGVRQEHTIIWEIEKVGTAPSRADILWPNHFSRLLGDKAFGLLIAAGLGLPVPRTTVIARALAPFTFGQSTGTSEPWIRTCPVTQEPGRFTTSRGWLDPFRLLSDEDPGERGDTAKGYRIASILAQEGVDATFSGALVSAEDGSVVVEGVAGHGDDFMKGAVGPQPLPAKVRAAVFRLFKKARRQLGLIRMEWVYDGTDVWVVQLHKGAVATTADTIVPGQPLRFRRFKVKEGLEALRNLLPEVQAGGDGIVLVGDVGITSHFGDLLRRAGIPSRLVRG